jgi:hypothetical protein
MRVLSDLEISSTSFSPLVLSDLCEILDPAEGLLPASPCLNKYRSKSGHYQPYQFLISRFYFFFLPFLLFLFFLPFFLSTTAVTTLLIDLSTFVTCLRKSEIWD